MSQPPSLSIKHRADLGTVATTSVQAWIEQPPTGCATHSISMLTTSPRHQRLLLTNQALAKWD
jgi:hypothetical protein